MYVRLSACQSVCTCLISTCLSIPVLVTTCLSVYRCSSRQLAVARHPTFTSCTSTGRDCTTGNWVSSTDVDRVTSYCSCFASTCTHFYLRWTDLKNNVGRVVAYISTSTKLGHWVGSYTVYSTWSLQTVGTCRPESLTNALFVSSLTVQRLCSSVTIIIIIIIAIIVIIIIILSRNVSYFCGQYPCHWDAAF